MKYSTFIEIKNESHDLHSTTSDTKYKIASWITQFTIGQRGHTFTLYSKA